MSVATSLNALSNAIDPTSSHWEVVLSTGKKRDERSLIPTLQKGVMGWRALDWTLDVVSTGDIKRVKELWLICPSGQKAILEITEDMPAFQFKSKTLSIMVGGSNLEFQAIGRVVDKATGACECWIWDYRPAPGQPQLLAYRSNIYHFGAWRDTMTPVGALSHDVQGWNL